MPICGDPLILDGAANASMAGANAPSMTDGVEKCKKNLCQKCMLAQQQTGENGYNGNATPLLNKPIETTC